MPEERRPIKYPVRKVIVATAVTIVVVGTLFAPAAADPTITRGEFKDADYLILQDLRTQDAEGTPWIYHLGIYDETDGVRVVVTRHYWFSNAWYAERGESAVVPDTSVDLEISGTTGTLSVDASLPKVGHIAFTAELYNYYLGPDLTVFIEQGTLVGSIESAGSGVFRNFVGSIGDDTITDFRQHPSGLYTNTSGWFHFLHA